MDSASLRGILARTDGSSAAIQKSAGAMMKLYDTAPVAVSEWRNALQTCQPYQLLPLLYVANEVLQNSKRNRGVKFLEAYSPVLGQSLIVMVERDESILEKVRRTVKIWGDRRVLSIRFVNELLGGLEPFREKARRAQGNESPTIGSFSPEPERKSPVKSSVAKSSPAVASASVSDVQADESESEDDNENTDGFGDSLGHLDVNLDFLNTSSAFQSGGDANSSKKKRRNSSMTSTTSQSATKRRKTILSTTSLMDLWNQVATLQDGLDTSKSLLKGISASASGTPVDQLVGDELLKEYNQTCKNLNQVYAQKHDLHKIASDRKLLEQEAVRYIPWLQASLHNDDDDVTFCRELQHKISLFQLVHLKAKQARDAKRQEEALQRQLQQEELKRKSEEEERKRFMESAMKKESEAKPGMVWSRERQEYVYLNTDESWRD